MNPSRRSLIGTILLTLALAPIAFAKGIDRQPNIVLMLADDRSYGDLSSYNLKSEGEAPNNTPIRTRWEESTRIPLLLVAPGIDSGEECRDETAFRSISEFSKRIPLQTGIIG